MIIICYVAKVRDPFGSEVCSKLLWESVSVPTSNPRIYPYFNNISRLYYPCNVIPDKGHCLQDCFPYV